MEVGVWDLLFCVLAFIQKGHGGQVVAVGLTKHFGLWPCRANVQVVHHSPALSFVLGPGLCFLLYCLGYWKGEPPHILAFHSLNSNCLEEVAKQI